MTIDLDKREYRALLMVLGIADCVLHGYRTEEPPETARIRALQQKILGQAERFGCGEMVEFDEDEQRWWLSPEAEQDPQALEFIEAYENESFWEQLCDRLVERDLLRQFGESACQRLGPEELEEKEEPYRNLYAAEFMLHGVDRLEILAQPTHAPAGSLLS